MGVNPKKINVGLVGYKFMGKAHSNALARLGMFFDPTALIRMAVLCGRDDAAVAQAAEKFGWASSQSDWKALVARDDIDVIDITAPSNAHKQIALAAARHKKHIFCEKPLALNVNDAREMLAAAEQNGICHQIGFNYRFAPAVRLAKDLIQKGEIGEVFHFRASYLQDWLIDPDFPAAWRTDKKVAGSGAHGDLGAHIIDLARYLVGEFDTVCGISKTFVKERPLVEQMTGLTATKVENADKVPVTVDDATLFVSTFKNGALGSFESTRFATGHKNDMSFEINGSKGALRFSFERMNELSFYSANDKEGTQGFRLIQATEGIHPYASNWWPVGHVLGYEHTFVHEMYEFFESIANGRTCQPNFEDGVKCAQVLDAVDLSIEQKQSVQVDRL